MHVRYNTKTMGARTARLIAELNEQRRTVFTVDEASRFMGVTTQRARDLLSKAEKRGLVTRLKPGLFNLVPFERGHDTFHVDNPYLIARALVGEASYFISHGSALELHALTTQPQLAISVSVTRRLHPQFIQGYEFRFIKIDAADVFGLSDFWVTPDQAIKISDPERSIIDGLHQPQHAGGVSEVAKALWIGKGKLKIERLIEYALRLDVGAVIRRLGYLLDLYQMADRQRLEALRIKLTPTYQRLEPLLPNEGAMLARWRIRLNIDPDELLALRHT